MPFKGVLSLVLPCLSILRLLLPRCIEQEGGQQDFFLSFEVTFSFSPSQILHPVHKPCFKVRTQKLSHFGIKLSKILKNGRVAAAALAPFLRFSLREIMTAKKVSQFFFPCVFQRLLHHLWEILRWRLLWFVGGSFASSVGELPSSSVVYGEVKWTEEITGRIGASNWCS